MLILLIKMNLNTHPQIKVLNPHRNNQIKSNKLMKKIKKEIYPLTMNFKLMIVLNMFIQIKYTPVISSNNKMFIN